MLIIIFDGKTAINAMDEGIDLCIHTVIPALFPFFLLSGIINNCLIGQKTRLLRFFEKICSIPVGSGSLLAVGFLAGYPVGAQLAAQAYQNGTLSKNTVRRMLGFCSNAGPSFLFGMLSPLFDDPKIPWVLWGIHIISALIVGWVLPGEFSSQCHLSAAKPISMSKALRKAIENIVMVCGWILIFRVILSFCNRWFLWLFPVEIQVLFSGILELSNGCVLLKNIPVSGTRFLLAEIMLSFGGLCVMMQTASVTQKIGLGYYFPGKILQTLLSACLCCLTQGHLFSQENTYAVPIPALLFLIFVTSSVLYFLRRKKVVAFGKKVLYNRVI